jgi:hypothetical protein
MWSGIGGLDEAKYGVSMLLPLIDMLNHDHEWDAITHHPLQDCKGDTASQQCTVDAERGLLSLAAHRPIRKGEMLYLNYFFVPHQDGLNRCNDELLSSYGFTLPTGYDCLRVGLSLPVETASPALLEAQRAALLRAGIATDLAVVVGGDGLLPEQALRFLRISATPENELQGQVAAAPAVRVQERLATSVRSICEGVQAQTQGDALISLVETHYDAIRSGKCGEEGTTTAGFSQTQCHILRVKLGQLQVLGAMVAELKKWLLGEKVIPVPVPAAG